MWWTVLSTLVPKIFGSISDYVHKKKDAELSLIEAQTQHKIAMVEQETKMIADADVASVKAQRYSWKDELIILCIFAPYIAAFIPGAQPFIAAGFSILNSMPYWYQVAIIGVIISVMGLRFMMGKFFSAGGSIRK